MSFSSLRPILAALLASIAATPLLALDVHTVAADGHSDFTTIQAAVDAAANGDVVLVRGGAYPAVTVDGKSLWIARVGTKSVGVPSVVVRNLAIDQRVVLAKIGMTSTSTLVPALHVIDNLGHVHVVDCAIRGRNVIEVFDGGPGAWIEDSRAVTMTRCSISGGGGGLSWGSAGGTGGTGLVSDRATPALYDCVVAGGSGGGQKDWPGGDGGTACHVKSRSVFMSGGTIAGGQGGSGHIKSGGGAAGDGGVGLIVDAAAAVQLLGVAPVGGMGGDSFWSEDGVQGASSSGAGTITNLQDTPRLLHAELVTSQSQLVSLEIRGSDGDRVYFGTSLSPGFTPSPAALGYDLLAPNARFNLRPIGTIGFGGILKVQVPMLEIGAQPMRPLFGQAIVVDVQGRVVRSGPVHFLVTNCAMLTPDCNGNGSWDVCDLADGTSTDSNGNDLSDECEFTQITHVDASAAPGGDGSEALPFQTIQEGVDASPDFQGVRVHDGVYTGPENRNIDLMGRWLHIESANGAASCILDLEDAGIAFSCIGQRNPPIRIAGFTIRNGDSEDYPTQGIVFGGGITVVDSNPLIEDCTFQDCHGSFAGAIGVYQGNPRIEDCTFEDCDGALAGAIYGVRMNSRVRGCRFIGNQSTSGGGAVTLIAAAPPTVGSAELLDCYCFGNVATQYGGAVRLIPYTSGHELRMSHCVVLANSAGQGGGIFVAQDDAPNRPVRIEDCVIAGNTAASGGGVGYSVGQSSSNKLLRNCTIVGNVATSQGGGVNANTSAIDNCLVWGNAAPLGAQIAVMTGTLNVRSCDVEGGQAGVHLASGGHLTWGAGNVDVDPLFTDADGLDDAIATFDDNDYRLGIGSPCIDAGDSALVSLDFLDLDGDSITNEPVPFDLDFLSRVVGAFVDLGAYEKQP
jgi:hypothetical protein